jgi:hypothetical protein
MLKFKLWIENIGNQIIQINSKEELISLYQKSNPETKKEILNWIEENINKPIYGEKLGTNNPILLYHGSPQESIAHQGLQITKGQRSRGFMGATYEVENHGIFMTDSKSMANYFGSNRSNYGRDYTVYEAYCNVDPVLDLSKPITGQIKKIGLKLINQYSGSAKTKLAESDIWWLLDQSEFIELIKSLGYNSVKFKEDYSIRKAVDKGSSTYLIFDPSRIMIKSQSKLDLDIIMKKISQMKFNHK